MKYTLQTIVNEQVVASTECRDLAHVAVARKLHRPAVIAARRAGKTARLNVQYN